MKLFKIIFISLFLIFTSYAKDLLPTKSLEANGAVTDLVINGNLLYAGTDASEVDIFDINKKELIKSIKISKIEDFMGDVIDAKIYSIDVLDDMVLILSQGQKGGRNIFIYKDEKLQTIISDKKRLFIAKAKFISKNKIIFSLLGNQLYLYDLTNNKKIYIKQISQSKFSDFSLNEKKNKVVIADESGNLHQYETLTGKFIKNFENQNLDNVFKVDWKKDKIITAGQDRRSVVYDDITNGAYYKQVHFLIYSCGLSPSSNLAGFASDEENNVTIFNTQSKVNLHKLRGNKMTLTNILFLNEHELFVSSDDKNINYYNLKD